ncbi:MAG: hypothetical protein IPK16_19560 [Anaerolineales bacterium]|nr:hypothetical protein [Anaerolineales bacterium]
MTLQWFEKPACRLPEALWYGFSPNVNEPKGWTLNKLDDWISPLEVIADGNKGCTG